MMAEIGEVAAVVLSAHGGDQSGGRNFSSREVDA